MLELLPEITLVRHGETAWTVSRQHTGTTDLPLTARGKQDARVLGDSLREKHFALVVTSPLTRARQTCDLAGLASSAEVDPDLAEWNYGEYEGLTTAEIHKSRPGWNVFRDGCPGGESPAEVGARADRALKRLRSVAGDVCVFSHGHFLRVFAARWLGLDPTQGRCFLLQTGTVSVLGYEHNRDEPVVRLWNVPPAAAS